MQNNEPIVNPVWPIHTILLSQVNPWPSPFMKQPSLLLSRHHCFSVNTSLLNHWIILTLIQINLLNSKQLPILSDVTVYSGDKTWQTVGAFDTFIGLFIWSSYKKWMQQPTLYNDVTESVRLRRVHDKARSAQHYLLCKANFIMSK